MVIRYTSTRSDVWRAYWQTWRHSPKLNVLRLFIFGWAFFVAWSQLTAFSMGPFWRLFSALALALTAMLLMAVYPLLRFKSDERALTISTSGIATRIGNLSGDVPWSKVARIVPTDECIYIQGRSGNSFAIPRRAFSTEKDREEFVRLATQWRAARG